MASDLQVVPEGGQERSPLAAVAQAISLVHKRVVGKGPEDVRVGIVGDSVVCLLSGGYTAVESTLVRRGLSEHVIEHRRVVQRELRTEFVTAVEAVLGVRVRSFMSANDPEEHLQAEIFVLESLPEGL